MEPSFIASGSQDNTIKVWKNSKKLFVFEGVGSLRTILEVFKFLSSKEIVGVSRVSRRFYEASFHFEVRKPIFREIMTLEGHNAPVYSVAVSEWKGILISAGGYDYKIIVWSLSTGQVTQVLKGHTKEVLCMTISSKADLVVSAGDYDFRIRVWNLNSGKPTLILRPRRPY